MNSIAEVVDLPRLSVLVDRLVAWLLRDILSWESLIQIVLVAAAFVVARGAARLAHPLLARWRERSVAGRRLIGRLDRLLVPMVAFLVVWLAYHVFRDQGYPALSPLLGGAASLLAAWVAINLATVMVSNPLAGRAITWAAWVLAALDITGLLSPTAGALESVSLSMGESRVSLLTLVKGALLATVLIWAVAAAVTLAERRMARTTDLSPAAQVLIAKVARFVLVTLALLLAIQAAGFDLSGLALLTGAVGVGIGFGLQRPVSNLISGVVMLLDGSVRPGDVIELNDTFGWVSQMGARAVSLITRDNKEILVPNEEFITQRAINWSHSAPEVRLEVLFAVSYASDPHRVREVAVEAAQTPDRVLSAPAPVCHLMEFADSGLAFRLRFWINDPTRGVANVTGQVLLALWDAFKAEGIEFPFPHRQIVVKDALPVRVERDAGREAPSRDNSP
jgi:small-conductance mechanosensitive channel